jgi:AAA+ superfamily predicted ATPase
MEDAIPPRRSRRGTLAENMMDKFKIKKITKFKDFLDPEKNEYLPTSNLCLTDDENIYQYEFIKEDENTLEKIDVHPGIYTINKSATGLSLISTELRTTDLLEKVVNTQKVMGEVKKFFSKLHIYDQYQMEKRRSVLFFSDQGLGKSSTIRKTCLDLIKEDDKTVVLIWPSSEVQPELVGKFFSLMANYIDCSRVILIVEDIGGVSHENYGSPREASSGLLNFLDGIGVTFTLPTFIVATTNHPETLLKSLADRPGRFDQLIELLPPKADERIALYEFFIKRDATDEEKTALSNTKASMLSIAHIKEIPLRMALHDKSITEVVNDMHEHTEKVKKSFTKERSMGFYDND